MSYFLVDTEDYLGDLASGGGLETLTSQTKFPSLKRFGEEGSADEALVKQVILEVQKDLEFGYIAEMLLKAKPPVTITDGIVEEEEIQEASYTGNLETLAKAIVNRFPEGTETVFDPMCGVGSVLFEAARRGMKVAGNDANPYAYRFTKGCLEGEKLSPEDADRLINPTSVEGWFTKEYTGEHPENKQLRSWVDGFAHLVNNGFKDKKLLTAQAVLSSFVGRFFGGGHTAMKSGQLQTDIIECQRYIRESIQEVNQLIGEVGGRGVVSDRDVMSIDIPKADVIFFDPETPNFSFKDYANRNGILLQEKFSHPELSNVQLLALLKRLAESCGILIMLIPEKSEIDWDTELRKVKPTIESLKLKTFREIEAPSEIERALTPRRLSISEADPYLANPPEDKAYKYVAQHHFRGKTAHTDLRMETENKDMLIGWTLNDLIAGAIKEPVMTLTDAREIEKDASKYFKIDWNTGEWAKRIKKGTTKPVNVTLMTEKKAPEPAEWLDYEGVTEPGEVGATKQYPGVFLSVDKGTVEYGAQKPWSHEYFFSGGTLKGKIVFRQLTAAFGEAIQKSTALQRHILMSQSLLEEDFEDDLRRAFKNKSVTESILKVPAETFKDCFLLEVQYDLDSFCEARILPPSEEVSGGVKWFMIKPLDQTPYVLTKEAVNKKWLPPLGISALPKKIRDEISEPMRFWNARKVNEAQMVRDELVGEGVDELPIVQEATKQFVLLYHWFSKVGEKLRAGASDFHFDLFLMNGKKEHFELDLDPLEAGEISAHPATPEFDHDEKAEGYIEPGEVGNPTKETGSWIEPWDKGSVVVYEDLPVFKKILFKGDKLKGLWVFEREAPDSEFWRVAKSELAPGVQEGGEGSGHWGHSGDSPNVGGSTSGGGVAGKKLPDYKKVKLPESITTVGVKTREGKPYESWKQVAEDMDAGLEVQMTDEQQLALVDWLTTGDNIIFWPKNEIGEDKIVASIPEGFADDLGGRFAAYLREGKDKGSIAFIHKKIREGMFLPKMSQDARQGLIDEMKAKFDLDYGKIGSEIEAKKGAFAVSGASAALQMWVFDKDFDKGMTAAGRTKFVDIAIQESWSTSSRSVGSQVLQQGIKDELGSNVPLWNSEAKAYNVDRAVKSIPSNVKMAVREHVRKTYNETQDWLGKEIENARAGKSKYIPQRRALAPFLEEDEIILFRGVKSKVTIQSPLSSWTVDPGVAKAFDGHDTIEERLNIKDIYVCVGSPRWKGMTAESEFIMIGKKEK
jgi:hypothetical protein